MTTTFQHRQAAHCESGVMSSLLSHYGLPVSEPMVFGLSASLAFAYVPLIKLAGMPLIGYRMPPKSIIRGVQKRLGLRMHFATYRKPEKGMAALDQALDSGKVVGLQTSVYWLPYFPDDMRFHFNGHNLLVYGRDGDDYCISDPVFEETVRCPRDALQRARFAKGALAAKGLLYYLESVPEQLALEDYIADAVAANWRTITKAPLPMIGVRGIRYLGRRLEKTAAKKDPRYLKLFLMHIVRMQEEIGTGGAGFRFLYAAFLQEAAELTGRAAYREGSELMTAAGDQWREFALLATKMCKAREAMDVSRLRVCLEHCADREQAAWDVLAPSRA